MADELSKKTQTFLAYVQAFSPLGVAAITLLILYWSNFFDVKKTELDNQKFSLSRANESLNKLKDSLNKKSQSLTHQIGSLDMKIKEEKRDSASIAQANKSAFANLSFAQKTIARLKIDSIERKRQIDAYDDNDKDRRNVLKELQKKIDELEERAMSAEYKLKQKSN
jgi:chromosome segregation ATPase